MGSVYAALLADAGHDVWAVDTWADHVAAINDHGLRREGASGDRVVMSIRTTTEVADPGPCDLCLTATKASGVGPGRPRRRPGVGAEALVLTIQNGMGAGGRKREGCQAPSGKFDCSIRPAQGPHHPLS